MSDGIPGDEVPNEKPPRGNGSDLEAVVMPCDQPCQKCGSQDIHRLFIKKGGKVPHEGYDKCASKYGTGQCNHWTATRDHIHHHCRCCGFTWQGMPLKRKAA